MTKKTSKAKKPGEGSGGGKPSALPVVITMLLDESGSMGNCVDATIEGFNGYVKQCQKDFVDRNVYFSAIKFDTGGVRKLQVGAPIKDAVELSRVNYTPTGGTPLLDAIGKTIQATDEIVTDKGADRVVLVVQTDGEENSSREFDLAKVKSMIEERTAKGWLFMFLGADINGFADARAMGFAAQNTASYSKDLGTTQAMFSNTSRATKTYASAATAQAGLTASAYTQSERATTGEADILDKVKTTKTTIVSTTDYSLKGTH